MAQTRSWSAIEAVANVVVGYALAVLIQIMIFPVSGLQATLSQKLSLGAIFTAASLARSYVLRRLFERLS